MHENSRAIVPIAPNTVIQGQDGRLYRIDGVMDLKPSQPLYQPPQHLAVNPQRYTSTHLLIGMFGVVGVLLSATLLITAVRPPAPVIVEPEKPNCIAFC